MSEPKFTSGPWEAMQSSDGWIVKNNMGGIALMYHQDKYMDGNDEANAKFIAAAPETKAKLDELERTGEDLRHYLVCMDTEADSTLRIFLERFTAALEKARER